MFFRNPQLAFNHALEIKQLSEDKTSPLCVDEFMYMHSEIKDGIVTDHFKNKVTRIYKLIEVK